MTTSANSVPATPAPDPLHAGFLHILPRIRLRARIYFRDVKCPGQRADRVADIVALAWQWYRRLAERGRDAGRFVSTLATLAARAVRGGRRVAGRERARDVLSPAARRRHGFTVAPLPASTRRPFDDICALIRGQQAIDAYAERLSDNHVTPPPDAAAFRIDFPRFLADLCTRDREMAMFLSLGHRATQAARQFGLSPGRVTQLRQAWCREWRRRQGDGGEAARPAEGDGA